MFALQRAVSCKLSAVCSLNRRSPAFCVNSPRLVSIMHCTEPWAPSSLSGHVATDCFSWFLFHLDHPPIQAFSATITSSPSSCYNMRFSFMHAPCSREWSVMMRVNGPLNLTASVQQQQANLIRGVCLCVWKLQEQKLTAGFENSFWKAGRPQKLSDREEVRGTLWKHIWRS